MANFRTSEFDDKNIKEIQETFNISKSDIFRTGITVCLKAAKKQMTYEDYMETIKKMEDKK